MDFSPCAFVKARPHSATLCARASRRRKGPKQAARGMRFQSDPLNSVQNAAFTPECPHHDSVTDAGHLCPTRHTWHLACISGSRHGSGHTNPRDDSITSDQNYPKQMFFHKVDNRNCMRSGLPSTYVQLSPRRHAYGHESRIDVNAYVWTTSYKDEQLYFSTN